MADIRDRAGCAGIRELRPEIVFHAAALKHRRCSRAPGRGAQEQRLGHATVLQAAAAKRPGVRQHLHRQGRGSDQRARLHQADRRAAHRRQAARTGATYLSVRFGNVLGSRGTVLTTFPPRSTPAARSR